MAEVKFVDDDMCVKVDIIADILHKEGELYSHVKFFKDKRGKTMSLLYVFPYVVVSYSPLKELKLFTGRKYINYQKKFFTFISLADKRVYTKDFSGTIIVNLDENREIENLFFESLGPIKDKIQTINSPMWVSAKIPLKKNEGDEIINLSIDAKVSFTFIDINKTSLDEVKSLAKKQISFEWRGLKFTYKLKPNHLRMENILNLKVKYAGNNWSHRWGLEENIAVDVPHHFVNEDTAVELPDFNLLSIKDSYLTLIGTGLDKYKKILLNRIEEKITDLKAEEKIPLDTEDDDLLYEDWYVEWGYGSGVVIEAYRVEDGIKYAKVEVTVGDCGGSCDYTSGRYHGGSDYSFMPDDFKYIKLNYQQPLKIMPSTNRYPVIYMDENISLVDLNEYRKINIREEIKELEKYKKNLEKEL